MSLFGKLAAPTAALGLTLTALPAAAHDIRADVLSQLTLPEANRLVVGAPNLDRTGCDWRAGEVEIGSTRRDTTLVLVTKDGAEMRLVCDLGHTPPSEARQPASHNRSSMPSPVGSRMLIDDRPSACQTEKETVGEIQDSLAEAAGDEPNGKIAKNLRNQLERALGALDDCRRKHPSTEPTKPVVAPKPPRVNNI